MSVRRFGGAAWGELMAKMETKKGTVAYYGAFCFDYQHYELYSLVVVVVEEVPSASLPLWLFFSSSIFPKRRVMPALM